MNLKITINNEDRIVIIPMKYDQESDSLDINEVQIEPVPDKDEDVSKDVVLNLAKFIIGSLKGNE